MLAPLVFRADVKPCPTEFIADTLTTTKALNPSEYGDAVKTLIGMIHHNYVITGDVAPLQSVVSAVQTNPVVSCISMKYAVIGAPLELDQVQAIYTPPVVESIDVVTELTQLGTAAAVIVVIGDQIPDPHLLSALTLN